MHMEIWKRFKEKWCLLVLHTYIIFRSFEDVEYVYSNVTLEYMQIMQLEQTFTKTCRK